MSIKPNAKIAEDFYKACQLVIDIMIRDDIHSLEYGQPFRSVNTQTMCGIIMELSHQGVMTRIEGSNIFTFNPSIYRLYYTRYYLRLIESREKERNQMRINLFLAFAAAVSACCALCSNSTPTKEQVDKEDHRTHIERRVRHIENEGYEILQSPANPQTMPGPSEIFYGQ